MALPPAYTVRMFDTTAVGSGVSLAPVPEGFRWVVRDISGKISPGDDPSAEMSVELPTFVTIADWQTCKRHNRNCHWVGRQAVYFGEELVIRFFGASAFYAITITGYQFVEP